MHLRFIVDPRYVVLYAMNTTQDYDALTGWDALMDKFYKRDTQAFNLLSGSAETILPCPAFASLPAVARRGEKMLADLLRTPTAKRIVRETRSYARRVEEEWKRNGKQVQEQLKELTRLPLPPGTIRVYISHPKLRNGRAVDRRTIVWGSSEEFPNSTTVYLAHELLHQLTWEDTTHVGHAAIELLADNELRIRLNGSGKYFQYPGHTELHELIRRLLPAWRTYLRTPSQDFRTFILARVKDTPEKDS